MVTLLQVVLRERARFSGKGLAQLAFVIMGFATMSLVEVYIGGHDHFGDHDHCHDHDVFNSTKSEESTLAQNLPNADYLIAT